MPDVSLVVIAKNEERTIGRVLGAARDLVSEIILVDSGSTDSTVEIAKRFSAKCFHQNWMGYAAQKNYAISLAAGDWILSLDADEVLTPELVSEIHSTLKSSSPEKYSGYRIPRILHIGDTPVTHGGFYPDAQLRLFRTGTGRFNDRLVHEAVFVEGPVRQLKNPMLHLSYNSIEEFKNALEKYAELSAQESMRHRVSCWHTHRLNEYLHPLWTFVYRYILRAGFLDGRLGIRLNLIYSDYVRRKIQYLRRAKASLTQPT